MRLTGLGKFIIFVLAVGISIGGWRMWQSSKSGAGNGAANPGDNGKGGGGIKLPSLPKFGGNDSNGNNGSNDNNDSDGAVEIPFVITAAKKDWVGEQVDRFNALQAGKWRIVTKPIPSREAMHQILSNDLKPVLWSPGSPVWPARLSEAYSQRNGKSILDLSDPNAYRVFLRTPLVFMTTRRKAQFLRPLLGGNDPWGALRQLSTGQRKTPWGSFRFSHADPVKSSSGVMTLGLILSDYAQKTGQSGSLAQVANSKQFVAYLRELNKSLVYDKPARDGTTVLTNAFIEDPARYDVITGYESAALGAMAKNPDIAVIYPNPTTVSEHAVTLLNGAWASPAQREGALAFMQFLGGKEALQGGLKYYFRPAQGGGSLSLSNVLSRYSGNGFKDSYATVELPPYEALNSAAYRLQKDVIDKRGF